MGMLTIQGNYRKGGTAFLMAQFAARDGTGAEVSSGKNLVKAADVSAVALAVYDLGSATPTTSVYTPTLTVGACIFDTLKEWLIDSVGANVYVTVPHTVFTAVEHTYKVKLTITCTSGNVGVLDFIGSAVD